MKKNVLNEEISRIKNMMGRINESEFDMSPKQEVSMEEESYDDEDENYEEEGGGEMKIVQVGIYPHDWTVRVYLPELEQEVAVDIEVDGREVKSIHIDDETTESSPIDEETKQMIMGLVKQGIEDRTIPLTEFIEYDVDREEFRDYIS
jgi:hypothetical protein